MDFHQKARFVARVHTTEALNSITYSRVVSCDSISFGILLSYLHGVDINVIDLDIAYLNFPREKNIWLIGGDEYKEDKGSVLLIVRALYVLKYVGFL